MSHDISVILATYNRAEDLSRTLKGMSTMERGNLSVEFIVIDNASTDRTKIVIDSFSERLPIKYLFEPRRGKSRALNLALEKVQLGKIVVFTDDDVDVSPDWIVSIASICNCWPSYSVFGGKINVVFPNKKIPGWASDPFIRSFAFVYHNYSTKECVYDERDTPFGPNYWVRRNVFDDGRRFDEALGPHPTGRKLGQETSFLIDLIDDGYEILYSPKAVVAHRIQPEMLKLSSILYRSYQLGRGLPYIYGLPQGNLLERDRAAWRLFRCGAIISNTFKILLSIFFSSKEQRLFKCTQKIRNIGYQIESMRFRR